LPKAKLVVLVASVGTEALSCRVKAGSAPAAFAVSVTVCAEETEDAVAEKLAVVAPAAMVTEAGTVTEELLLARLTANALAAAVFSETVQASVVAPVSEALEQVIALSVGAPVPERVITAVPLVDELLLIVTVPVAAPAAVGSNCTVSVAD